MPFNVVKRAVNHHVRNCLCDVTLDAVRCGGAANLILQCVKHLGEADEVPSHGAGEYLMEVGMTTMGQATVNRNRNPQDTSIEMFSGVRPGLEHINSHPVEQGG